MLGESLSVLSDRKKKTRIMLKFRYIKHTTTYLPIDIVVCYYYLFIIFKKIHDENIIH